MKAAGYIRVSTAEQAREGYGLAAQEQAVRSFCQAHGWDLTEIYSDAGRSGSSIQQRESLSRLLEDAQAGAFERVVFLKLDRLARNLRDLLGICDGLEEAAVGIVSIQESIDTGTATGRMIRSVLGALSEFERDTIIGRIKDALAEKARQGEILGRLPLGYMRDEDGAVVADPVIGPLVRAAYERYNTGAHSLLDLAIWAADVGLRSNEGNPLDRVSIRKLLCNITYAGMVTHHGKVVGKGKHPAIVDSALFAAVQETMHSRKREPPPPPPRPGLSDESRTRSQAWRPVIAVAPTFSVSLATSKGSTGTATTGAARHTGRGSMPARRRWYARPSWRLRSPSTWAA